MFDNSEQQKYRKGENRMGILFASIGITAALGAGVYFLIKKFDK